MQWSKIKKYLDSFLCDSLKSRVRYYDTSYRDAHDDQGRVCILVDEKEVLDMPYTNKFKLLNTWFYGTHDYEKAISNTSKEGILSCDFHFCHAYNEYLHNSIDQNLNSQNYLVRVFAIMDRRVGKRTLEKLRDEVGLLP